MTRACSARPRTWSTCLPCGRGASPPPCGCCACCGWAPTSGSSGAKAACRPTCWRCCRSRSRRRRSGARASCSRSASPARSSCCSARPTGRRPARPPRAGANRSPKGRRRCASTARPPTRRTACWPSTNPGATACSRPRSGKNSKPARGPCKCNGRWPCCINPARALAWRTGPLTRWACGPTGCRRVPARAGRGRATGNSGSRARALNGSFSATRSPARHSP